MWYDIEILQPSQAVTAPKNIIFDTTLNEETLPITFNFKGAVKDYFCQVILKSYDLKDVRRYSMNLTALPKPVKLVLEMKTPAREIVF